jgi:hypothetical protein
MPLVGGAFSAASRAGCAEADGGGAIGKMCGVGAPAWTRVQSRDTQGKEQAHSRSEGPAMARAWEGLICKVWSRDLGLRPTG